MRRLALLFGTRRDAADDASAGANADATLIRREDRGGILLKPHVRDDGTLLLTGRTAKPGIYRYSQPDGSVIRELVPASTLHHADSLGTLGRAPVTLEHPDEDVSPTNIDRFGVGDVDGEVSIESEGYVTVRFAVRRADAIKAVQEGKHQLSPGYAVGIDPTGGIDPVFGEYDAVQVSRRYNHLAIVDAARGGPDIRLRTDGVGVQLLDEAQPPRRHDMLWFTSLLALLGLSHTDSEDVAKDRVFTEIKALKARADAFNGEEEKKDAGFKEMEKERDVALKSLSKAEGERDALQKSLDKMKDAASKKDAEEARTHLDSLATDLAFEADDATKALDNEKFAHALAKHVDSDLADDAAPAYVQGLLAMARKNTDSRNDTVDPWSAALTKADGDDAAQGAKPGNRDDSQKELAVVHMSRYDDDFNSVSPAAE